MKNNWLALILCTTIISSQAQSPQQPTLQITPAITRTVIDSLGQALKHNYVFPDTAAKMAAYLDNEYKKEPTPRSTTRVNWPAACSRTCKKPITTAIFTSTTTPALQRT
ncbi:hypothetical protein ACQ86N_30040 [Puia sp. P3]|uniref:hypothetical protein n=1 Tax=Puia sp. P3 TaxID=3423952 RepID=UPI003D67BFFF